MGNRNGAIRFREDDMKVSMILADDSIYPFGGSLNFIDRTVDRNTSTLPFRLEFPNPSGILRPGQFARLRVVLEDLQNALAHSPTSGPGKYGRTGCIRRE